MIRRRRKEKWLPRLSEVYVFQWNYKTIWVVVLILMSGLGYFNIQLLVECQNDYVLEKRLSPKCSCFFLLEIHSWAILQYNTFTNLENVKKQKELHYDCSLSHKNPHYKTQEGEKKEMWRGRDLSADLYNNRNSWAQHRLLNHVSKESAEAAVLAHSPE